MSTYREAIHHARAGGTVRRGAQVVRFLTREEAEPIILERSPSRAVAHDEDGVVTKNGAIVVETFADPNFRLQKLGLFDVGMGEPIEFKPIDDDIYLPVELDEEGKEKPRVLRTDWEIVKDEVPTVVAPEVVDEVLHEEAPQ
jgi:hypothetical protein